MVNEALGEVEIKSRFDDTTHLFAFGPNQLANVEQTLRKDVSELFNEMGAGRISAVTLRTLIRLTYVSPKGAKALTDTQAGDVLNAVGYKPYAEALSEGVKWIKFGTGGADDAENPTEAGGGASA